MLKIHKINKFGFNMLNFDVFINCLFNNLSLYRKIQT